MWKNQEREMGKSLLRIDEVAEELSVSRQGIYRLIAKGVLNACAVGVGSRPRLRVTRASVEGLVAGAVPGVVAGGKRGGR